MDLFGNNSDAVFSECRKYRYVLWRIWDVSKPRIMFIGINPSKANETKLDPTVTRVRNFAASWGFGGVYMCNCFPYVSTDPNDLNDYGNTYENDKWLLDTKSKVTETIFAWGSFDVVMKKGRDRELIAMFPGAKALQINKNGSPKHPLYVKGDIIPVIYATQFNDYPPTAEPQAQNNLPIQKAQEMRDC